MSFVLFSFPMLFVAYHFLGESFNDLRNSFDVDKSIDGIDDSSRLRSSSAYLFKYAMICIAVAVILFALFLEAAD